MKKIFTGIVICLLVFGAILYLRGGTSSSKTVRLIAWSGYFSDNILAEFTKKTGIKVELSYISSNEELFSKLKAGAGGYDLIMPSDYMVEQMSKLNMLKPLNNELLPHRVHLEDYYLHLPYDPGLKYTVPFVRGTTGIAINTERVKVPEEGVTWDFLFNSSDPTHTSFLDDMREVFAAALFKAGKSPNSKDESTLQEARQLIAQTKTRIALFSSEPLPLLLRGDITIAHAFSTHGIQAGLTNPKIKYFLPKEGNTVWTDNFAIPVNTAHTQEAHQFIDYFLDPTNALAVVNDNHLATPNRNAWMMLPAGVQKDETLYPNSLSLSKMLFLSGIDEGLAVMNRLWTEIKS